MSGRILGMDAPGNFGSAITSSTRRGRAPTTTTPEQQQRRRQSSLSSTRSLLIHISVFLAGIFCTTLLSSIRLTNEVTSKNKTNNDGGGGFRSVLDQSISSRNTLENDLQKEKQKTKELEEMIARLLQQQNDAQQTGIVPTDDSKPASFQQQLLQSYNQQYNQNHHHRNNKQEDLCSTILPKPTPTTLSLWSHHISNILNASKHFSDLEQFQYHDFTALLLHFITPDRLQRSVKTLPLDWTPVERSLHVIQRRLHFLQSEMNTYRQQHNLKPTDEIPRDAIKTMNKHPNAPRKLNVLIMGGSVTMGVVCHINPVTSGGPNRRDGAWPSRLNEFFPKLFHEIDLINIQTIALGGTNTESAVTMWDYSLLSDDIPYPDVLINAYATNDMHWNSMQDAKARNETLEQSLYKLTQEFIRQVMTPKRSCRHAPPLLLYFDDYLGNEQNEVLSTMASTQTINLMSSYYGIGSISYADAVRDIVYGDTKEWWFSSQWYERGKYMRGVHPGMGAHLAMMWVVAFNLFHLVTTYCSLPEIETSEVLETDTTIIHRLHAGTERNSKGEWDYNYQSINGLPSLRATKKLGGGPREKPRGIPPPLTTDLLLEHISDSWRQDSVANAPLWKTIPECVAEGHFDDAIDHDSLPKPCLFSWVVNMERFLNKPNVLTNKLKPYLTSNSGWSAEDDNNKLGWVPSSGLGSKFTLEFKKVAQPVLMMTWMIMRSYGEKWEGSKLKVEAWSGEKLLASDEIVGFHDKKTSETYNIKMKLIDKDSESPGIPAGSDLKVTFELVGGTTFKISGMAICDH
jgi:lysophospholipase L1-like esterase